MFCSWLDYLHDCRSTSEFPESERLLDQIYRVWNLLDITLERVLSINPGQRGLNQLRLTALLIEMQHFPTDGSDAAGRSLEHVKRLIDELGYQHQSLFGDTEDLMLMHSVDHRVLGASERFLEELGWRPRDLLGQPTEQLVAPEWRSTLHKHYRPRMWGQGALTNYPIGVVRQDGSRLELVNSTMIIPASKSLPRRAVTILRAS